MPVDFSFFKSSLDVVPLSIWYSILLPYLAGEVLAGLTCDRVASQIAFANSGEIIASLLPADSHCCRLPKILVTLVSESTQFAAIHRGA